MCVGRGDHQGRAVFILWPPAMLKRLPDQGDPFPSSAMMNGETELQPWGCLRAQKGLQDQGLECLRQRGTWAQGQPRDKIRTRGRDIPR